MVVLKDVERRAMNLAIRYSIYTFIVPTYAKPEPKKSMVLGRA